MDNDKTLIIIDNVIDHVIGEMKKGYTNTNLTSVLSVLREIRKVREQDIK